MKKNLLFGISVGFFACLLISSLITMINSFIQANIGQYLSQAIFALVAFVIGLTTLVISIILAKDENNFNNACVLLFVGALVFVLITITAKTIYLVEYLQSVNDSLSYQESEVIVEQLNKIKSSNIISYVGSLVSNLSLLCLSVFTFVKKKNEIAE